MNVPCIPFSLHVHHCWVQRLPQIETVPEIIIPSAMKYLIVSVWCSKTFKKVQYSTSIVLPRSHPSFVSVSQNYIINHYYRNLLKNSNHKEIKMSMFSKKKKKSSQAERHRKEPMKKNTSHTFSERIEEGEKIVFGSGAFEIFITRMLITTCLIFKHYMQQHVYIHFYSGDLNIFELQKILIIPYTLTVNTY